MSGAGFPVDGHVHLYSCFDLEGGLQAAQRNLKAARHKAGLPADAPGVLLLTETATEGAFARLAARKTASWGCEQPEETALILRWPDRPPLVVIAGRQFQSAERIEVLGIGTRAPGRDGAPLAQLLETLIAEEVPAILPWGVGKWLGRRGEIVAEIVAARPGLLLGDNAGRPAGWPDPALFADHVVLPGTDPLPRRGAEAGIGRYGFVLDGPLDLAQPASDLRRRLATLKTSPDPFGRRVSTLRALTDQIRLRLPG